VKSICDPSIPGALPVPTQALVFNLKLAMQKIQDLTARSQRAVHNAEDALCGVAVFLVGLEKLDVGLCVAGFDFGFKPVCKI